MDKVFEWITNWECTEQYENGKCPVYELCGKDCGDNDNHCLVKEIMLNAYYESEKR